MSTTAEASAPAEHIEEAVVVEAPGQELAPSNPAPVPVTTDVSAGDLVKRLETIKDAMQNAMQVDVDYGVIPGTNKPTLLKPGSEKLSVLFQLDPQVTHEQRWGPGDHLTVTAYATIFHAPTGSRLGRGEGLCSTREKKYAYRNLERTCPECGKANIRRSKNDGGGWYCWRKTDGCGANFEAGDQRITSQEAGQIDNPDLPDTWNTVIKMARKRALVDAVLLVTGASALFTQDVEDQAAARSEEPAQAYGQPVTPEQLTNARAAIAYLYDPEHPLDPQANPVGYVLNELEKAAGGYLPHFALSAIVRVAVAAKARRADGDTQTELGDPADETAEEKEQRAYAERVAAEGGPTYD